MVKTTNGNIFTKQREIAAGGEGKIFEHPSDKNKVVKIYHKPRDKKFVDHLVMLSSLGPMFIKPVDIYIDSTTLKVIGFDMQYVDFNNYFLFNNLFNKGFCSAHNVDKGLKFKIMAKLKSALEHIHQYKIVVGDLNQYNLFFNLQGDIIFVDVDSYQTPTNTHSGVLLDDIRDWTTSAINEQTDGYAYDVLAFWAITFCHPYKWMVPGNKEPLEMRVKAHKSILSKIAGIKIPPLYEAPTGDLLKQFSEIFNNGRRYMVNMTGVHVPVSTVVKQQIAVDSNSLTIKKLHEGIRKIFVCDSKFAIETKPGHWSLVESVFKGVTRSLRTIDCDEIYPSDNGYAYKKGDSLYSQDDKLVKSFRDPVFYWNNGYLVVIEYPVDLQWNYNLNNQLAGIDNTNTPVFAKSIVKRAGLLQNFGSQKYLNVPYLNRYAMIPVPPGTKDGFYIKEYAGVEIKGKNSVEYQIRYVKDANNHTTLDLDYLPYFAVALGGTIMIPEDGYVDVYTNLQLLTRLECSICTRDSKLFYTKSGILLLEDKCLYLLNTK